MQLFPLLSKQESELMSQVIKRRSTPETKAGQYMCPECGQIFDSKREVNSHLDIMHEPRLWLLHGNFQD